MMRRHLLAAAASLFVAAASTSAAQTPAGSATVRAPATAAGKVVTEWLDAFNSADSARLASYYQKWHLVRNLSAQLQFRRATGGFDLVSIERSEPTLVEFVMRERNNPAQQAYGIIEIAPDDTTLRQSYLIAMRPGTTPASFAIDAPTRARVIEHAIAQLDTNYVFPEVATKMAAALHEHQKRGDYDAIRNGATFAARLTDDLQAVSHDRHLRVNFVPGALPNAPDGSGPDSATIAQRRREATTQSCGFVRTDTLAGNVGYLKFNGFADPDVCGEIASRELTRLADTKALIVDLRDNGGGDPAMVAYISSYLFDTRTHLNDLWTRRTNKTDEYWTRDVPGARFGGKKPVYVLTSSYTFSGAEEFTYNLKNLKRATIIGETTGGGAHPVDGHRIDDHFLIGVPFARAINPYSHTNWEGTGVTPDVKVPRDEALATAQKLIAEGARP
ncbi:MAG TPA: S41 family peptidase [Gemmatimonadaceae bacterium]|nr:S41 family peptidase [Gemmatimonadaceae bacterium]